MSESISVKGLITIDNPEFKRHFGAVKYCAEHALSYPIETVEFFKGKTIALQMGVPDVITAIHNYIKDGAEVDLPLMPETGNGKVYIKVSDIPKEVDTIVIDWC